MVHVVKTFVKHFGRNILEFVKQTLSLTMVFTVKAKMFDKSFNIKYHGSIAQNNNYKTTINIKCMMNISKVYLVLITTSSNSLEFRHSKNASLDC